MEIEESLNFYLTKNEVILALKAGKETGRYLTAIIYLCCDVRKINLDDFIKMLTDYKAAHPKEDFMYDNLIFRINEIVHKTEII